MSRHESLLPPGYEGLERFVARFAVAEVAARAQLRNDCSRAEREDFFRAVKDLAGPALDALDLKPLADLDEKERRLLDLLLSFAHVALAVEVQGDDEEKHARLREHMRISVRPPG